MARAKVATPLAETNGHRRAITASAERIDPTDRTQAAKARKSREKWQQDVWDLFDAEPTVAAPHRYIGNAMSRVRAFAAYRPDPHAEPVPLDPDDPDQQDDGLTEIAVAAREEMERIAGPAGSSGPIMGGLGLNVGLVGEGYLYAKTVEGVELWDVLSTEEIKPFGEGWKIYENEQDRQGRVVAKGEYVCRIWRRHPRWRNQADAPMRALIETADQLLLMSRSIKVTTMSRMSAGLLALPSQLDLPGPSGTDGQNGQATDNPFIRTLIDAATMPVQDPGSASALVPLVIRGPADALKELRYVTQGRSIDADQIKLREELRQMMGIGLDLPIEILLGLKDANHWSAWQIDEQTFKAYLEPLAMVLCAGLTTEFLQPALRAHGLDPTNVVVWYDPSELIGDPDNFDHAERMHKEFTVSDAYFRRAGGASEDDAPDEEEILRRIDQTRGRPQLGGPQWNEPQANVPPGTPEQVIKAAPVPPAAAPAPPAKPVAASARPVANLGAQLEAIDRALMDRIHGWADAAVRRLLEIASARTRSAMNKKTAIAAAYKDRAGLDYMRSTGAQGLVAVGLAESDLLDQKLGDLEDRYRKATRRAYAAALLLAFKAAEKPLSQIDKEALVSEQEEKISAGWAVLSAGVSALAQSLLFAPPPQAPLIGEHNDLALVPFGLVRDSIAVAGGANGSEPHPGGIATGTTLTQTLTRDLGAQTSGFQWVYGDPSARSHPFEPHEDLEGTEFASWESDVLANSDSFPDTEFYAPGDHDGCGCLFIPIVAFGEGAVFDGGE